MNRRTLLLFELLRTLAAIFVALVIAFIIIFFTSETPFESFGYLTVGPLRSMRHFGNVLELLIPLIFAGLATSIMFSAAQFNLGTEGAFFIGGVVAAFIAIKFPLPPFVHPATAILLGGAGGALFCFIPAIIKAKWECSELVSSLMLNYVALFLGLFLINYFLRDPHAGAMVSFRLANSAKIIQIVPRTRIHAGLFLAFLTLIFAYLYLFRTRWGYQARLVGSNMRFAVFSGISANAVIVYSQIIGGFIGGAGGAVEILGIYNRFEWQALPGYGWDGVIVAILARNNPLFLFFGALFLAYIRIGADLMARYGDVQNELISLIQGIIIVLIAASNFLGYFRNRITVRNALTGREEGAPV